MSSRNRPTLMPHLVVKDAAAAIRFYQAAFGAKETMRFADAALGGTIVHAELAIRDAVFSLAEEAPDWGNVAPKSLGGSPVVLTLECPDVDAVAAAALTAGARLLIPVADQFYGYRQGRIEDPFGHLWILSMLKEHLSIEEMHERNPNRPAAKS